MRLSKLSISAIVFCVLAICGYFFRDAVGIFVFKSYTGFGLEHYQYMFLIVPLAIILLLVGFDFAKTKYASEEFPVNGEALKIAAISTATCVGLSCIATIFGMINPEKYAGLINILVLVIILNNTLLIAMHFLVFTQRYNLNRYKPNTASIAITIVVTLASYMVLSAYRLSDKFSDYTGVVIVPLFAFSVLFTNAFKNRKLMLPNILASLSFLSLFAGGLYDVFSKSDPFYLPVFSIAIAITFLIVALELAKEIAKTQPITDNLDQQKSIP